MNILKRIKMLEDKLMGHITQKSKSNISDEDRGWSIMALLHVFYDKIYSDADEPPSFEEWVEFFKTVEVPEYKKFAEAAKKFCTPGVIKKYMKYYNDQMEFEETRKRLYQNNNAQHAK